MNNQSITLLILVGIVAFILWVRARNRRLQREHDEALAQKWRETHKTPEENEIVRAVRRKQLVAEFNARNAARSARSQLRHPEQYTKEEIEEAVAMGFIPPDDPAVDAALRHGERSQAAEDPDLRDFDRDFEYDPDDLTPDLDEIDDFDDDLEDLDLSDGLDDLDDFGHDEDDWDRNDAVMRAQSNLRIMREEDQNYALDAIEAEVLNLDHEPDEDELVAIADRAADFYDMSEDYRDY